MAVKSPYRFQMYMDQDLREAIRRIAYRKNISMNTLVYDWIEAKVQEEKERTTRDRKDGSYE